MRAFASEAAQPAELCHQVNRILCGRIAEGRFISFFYCRPWFNGEYVVFLKDGTRLTLSRGYREKLRERLGRTL